MWILYSFVFYLIGLFVFSFTIIIIFTIFRFGIPTTKRLVRLGFIKADNKIVQRYAISVILLLVIFLVVSFCAYTFFPNQFVAYLIGIGFSLVFGLGQTGANRNNLADYMQSNHTDFTASPEEVLEAIMSK